MKSLELSCYVAKLWHPSSFGKVSPGIASLLLDIRTEILLGKAGCVCASENRAQSGEPGGNFSLVSVMKLNSFPISCSCLNWFCWEQLPWP